MFNINDIIKPQKDNFFLIAGPCVVENEENTYTIATQIKNITDKLKIPFIFKASYRKANRTRIDSFQGIGDNLALNILSSIRKNLNIPVITDVHAANEIEYVIDHIDIIQIPAFLCRQTDILIQAGKSNKHVNIKKGQFIAAEAMKYAIEKINSTGNNKIILTERGTMFGYNDLIVDFRNIPIMKTFGYPVIIDITHSVQQPNTADGIAGGKPQFINTIAKCGIVAGADGIFLETHFNPQIAKSDGNNMLPLNNLQQLLETLIKIKLSISNTNI